mmetsp:Transcript_33258/g.52947  ORF Transcript_33258/g.52947 Transcript_33258/m.52947 type:complete len:585 (-) Transcript_33258:52-1806(-)
MGILRSVIGTTIMEEVDLSFDFEAEIDAKDALRKASLKADGHTGAVDNANAKGRHSLVCRHWVKNLCMKGDKCDYLHQYDPNRMPECFSWLKTGKCADPECVFRHVETSERPECQRYRLGFCKFGPMCRSRHDRLHRDSLPAVLPDWFLDALLLNSYLIPKAEDVRLDDRSRNGSSGNLALTLGPETEQGTIPGLPPPIHGKCRYYIMRSMNVRNVLISVAKGIWATSLGNSQRLRQSFRDVDHVILIFAATESRNFLGYAKMLCEPDDRLFPGIWGDMSNRLSPNFRVQWIKQCSESMAKADHIKNPQNENLPVRRSRDGQDLTSSAGEVLCRFLWQQANADLLIGTDLEFEPRVDYDILAIRDQERDQLSSANNEKTRESFPKASPPSAPLALEDVRKNGDAADDGRERPAPVAMGTFDRDGSWKHQVQSGPPPVTVGKALASGSSSLLAAVREADAHRHGMPPPMHAPPHGMWPPGPAPAGWRPPLDMRPPMYGFPPPGYYAPGFAGAPQPFGPGGVPPARPRPHLEAVPPGFWGGAAPDRAHFSQPPAEWEGASSALAPPQSTREEGRKRKRSRSRKRRK